MAWKSGKLVASLRIRRAFWTLSRESLLTERAKNGTNRWSCNAAASRSCKRSKEKSLIIGLHQTVDVINDVFLVIFSLTKSNGGKGRSKLHTHLQSHDVNFQFTEQVQHLKHDVYAFQARAKKTITHGYFQKDCNTQDLHFLSESTLKSSRGANSTQVIIITENI